MAFHVKKYVLNSYLVSSTLSMLVCLIIMPILAPMLFFFFSNGFVLNFDNSTSYTPLQWIMGHISMTIFLSPAIVLPWAVFAPLFKIFKLHNYLFYLGGAVICGIASVLYFEFHLILEVQSRDIRLKDIGTIISTPLIFIFTTSVYWVMLYKILGWNKDNPSCVEELPVG